MPNNSTPSLPTSPSPTRKTFSSQHNVWNKLLSRAEKRAPQMESHLYLPRDPGDDHLRASFEDYLINHQLQIEAVFRIPVKEPARPKRKAAKSCIPRPSTYRSQQSRATSIAPIAVDDNEFDIVLVEDDPPSTLPSTNGSDDYVIKRKRTIELSRSGSDIPRSQRLRNDRALYSEPSAKPSLLVLPQQHAPERSRRRVSKSTPLSTLHNPLSSLEPSEESPTLYSCDSGEVASRIESTPDVGVEDSSLKIVPMVSSPDRRAISRGMKRDSTKSNGRGRLKRAIHDSDGDIALGVFSLSSPSGGSEISKPETVVAEPRRSKSTINLCSSEDDDLGSKSNRFKRDSEKPKGDENFEQSKLGSAADAPMRGTDPFSISEHDVVGFDGARVKSKRVKRDFKRAKDRGRLNRTKPHSAANASVRETDLLSFSEDDMMGSAAAGAKSKRARRDSKKAKGRGRLNRATPKSEANASVPETDLLSYSEDDVVGFAAEGTKSKRAKRDLKKVKGRGSSSVTEQGFKGDIPMRRKDPFSLSEEVLVGFDGARVKSKRAKRDFKTSRSRGSLSGAKIGSKADASVRETDLLSFSEDDVVEFEAERTKTRQAVRNFRNPKVLGTLNGTGRGSTGDASLRVMSLSSSKDDISQPEPFVCHRPRFAFRKSVGSIIPTYTSCDVEDQHSSESGILALPPDCKETHPAPNQSPSINACQENDDEGHKRIASKQGDEDRMLLPLKLRRVGNKLNNKRAESNESSTPVQTESGHSSRMGTKKRVSSNLSRPLMTRSQALDKSSEVHTGLQPKETHRNENQNISSNVMRGSQLRANGYTGTDALTSDVEIDGGAVGDSSGNQKDAALPVSSNCSEEVSHKGCGSPRDLSEDRLLREPKTMPTPSGVGKKRQLTIPLTLRIRQPRAVDLHQSLEKRRRTGEVRKKEKSKNYCKPASGKKASRGQVGRRKSDVERESMSLDKSLCQSSSDPGLVTMKDQEDITLGKESNISISHQRYPLRSGKQVSSERTSDSATTRRATKHAIRKSYNLGWSLKRAAAARTTDSSEPSLDAQFAASPSSELLLSNLSEERGFEGSRPTGECEIGAKRLCSGKTSPSKGLQKKARADTSRKQSSSSRKWKKDNVTTRGKRRRVRGENGSKRFGLSGSDIAFPPLGSLRKRGTRRSKLFG